MRILGTPRRGLLSDDAALAARLSVGMVFQNGALFDSLTVGENVGFLLYEHTRLPDRRIRARASRTACRDIKRQRAKMRVQESREGALLNKRPSCLFRARIWV